MNAIAQILDVSAQSILNWIRDFEKPAPDSVVVVELDEVCHFVGSKKTKFGSGMIMGDLLTGNWRVVKHSAIVKR